MESLYVSHELIFVVKKTTDCLIDWLVDWKIRAKMSDIFAKVLHGQRFPMPH